MTVIKLEHVNLIRNQKQILKDINWQVRKGENWAILGLNGSGKSSLIKLILAEEWKSSGEIEVLGIPFGKGEIPKLRKRVSVVGSFIAERFTATIKCENLVYTGKFNSSMLYKPYTDSELDEARRLLAEMSASEFIGRSYGSLSQGEKQLILIARSLILQPEILILDEATNGLDLFAKEKLLKQIHEISHIEKAPTILFISHHPDEISADFTQVLLLKNGEIFKSGKKEEIMSESVLTNFYEQDIEVHQVRDRFFVIVKNRKE